MKGPVIILRITIAVLLLAIHSTDCLLFHCPFYRFSIQKHTGRSDSSLGVVKSISKTRFLFARRRMSHDSDDSANIRTQEESLESNHCIKSNAREQLIKNFRKAAGLNRVYRCGNTDGLGGETATAAASGVVSFLEGTSSKEQLQETTLACHEEDISASILLHRAGLILDLRSDTERKEILAQTWMRKAPRSGIQAKYFTRNSDNDLYSTNDTQTRYVYRIDLLSPKRLFDYMFYNWISSPFLKLQYIFNNIFDTTKLHEMRMDVLNEKGLQGLYEAMLETSGNEFCAALKAMTVYLENNQWNKEDVIVVHCVQGKDRTGLVIMLCQAILGIHDEDIVKDYHESEKMLDSVPSNKTQQNDERKVQKGKLNKSFFSGSPKAAMVSTLTFLREKYGSIDSYLDFIGFDASWRQRFRNALQEEDQDDASASMNNDDIQLLPIQMRSKL